MKDLLTPAAITGAILGFVGATTALLVEFGVPLTDGQQAAIGTWVSMLLGLILIAVAALAWKRGVDLSRVVERTDAHGLVTAGPANELVPAGVAIRHLGDEPRRALPDEALDLEDRDE